MNKITLSRRDQDHARSLVKNLLTSLFIYGKVETTLSKAKILRSLANKALSRAFRYTHTFNAIRYLNTILFHDIASKRIIDEYKPKYEGKTNYVRMIKNGIRKGDGAPKAIVELI